MLSMTSLKNVPLTLNFVCDFLNTTLPQLRDLGLRIEPEKISVREEDGKIFCELRVYDGEWWDSPANREFSADSVAYLAELLERKTFERQLRTLAPRILAVNWRPVEDYTRRTDPAADFLPSRRATPNMACFRTASGEPKDFPISYEGIFKLHDALRRAEAIRDLAPYQLYFEQMGWALTLTEQQAVIHYECEDHIYNLRHDEIQSLIAEFQKHWNKSHTVPILVGFGDMVEVEPGANALSSDVIV